MPTLKSSIRSPSVVEDKIAVKESSTKKANADAVRSALARWEVFKKTRTYTVTSELVDPKIRNLTNLLKLSRVEVKKRLELPLATDMDIAEFYAEVRGELKMWEVLKYEPWRLELQLKELGQEGGEKEEGPKVVPPEIKQYLD